MSAGDWVALAAAIVSLAAMLISLRQANEAKKAHKAAESQAATSERAATAAEEHVALARAEVEQERLAREEQESVQARLILIDVGGMGELTVEIANHSDLPVTKLLIENVVYAEHPDTTWTVNRRVIGSRADREQLAAGDSTKVPVEFTGSDGSLVRGESARIRSRSASTMRQGNVGDA
ncbi:MAG TPA: hypothetical protein VGN81_16920 [Pseudonocardiaceae bacterium]|jgi:hypothetical protein